MDLLINLRDLTGSNLSAALLGSVIFNLSFYVLIRVSKAIYRIFQFELFAATSKNLSIAKIQFIREIVGWCVENLGLGRNAYPPTIQLLYYKNANYNGIYYSFGKQNIIYWNNHV